MTALVEQLVLFYADDGLIAARNHEWLQMAIDRLNELFERVGLRTNTSKTQAMTCTPGHISSRMSSPA
jgi:ribosome assembly protein YihI (activator of Der GTPase)